MNTALFFIFMLPATMALGLHDVLARKILTRNINEQVLLSTTFLVTGLVASGLAWWLGWPVLQPGFWPAFLGTMSLNIFGQWAWYRAFKLTEVSIVSPLRLLTPPLVIFTGALVLHEIPTFRGILGVLVMMTGLWFLLRRSGPISTAESHKRQQGIWLAILGSLFFAFSFPLDKKAILASSSIFFVGLIFPLIGLGNVLIYWIRHKKLPDFKSLAGGGMLLPLFFATHLVGTALAAHSLNFAIAVYASSVKRLLSFWAVLLSGAILREKAVGRKLLATVLMLAGILFMVL